MNFNLRKSQTPATGAWRRLLVQASVLGLAVFAEACTAHLAGSSASEEEAAQGELDSEDKSIEPPKQEEDSVAGDETENEPKKTKKLPCFIEENLEFYCNYCHSPEGQQEPYLHTWTLAHAARDEIEGVLIGTGPAEMPPRGFYPDEERDLLLDWIGQGAPEASSEEPACSP